MGAKASHSVPKPEVPGQVPNKTLSTGCSDLNGSSMLQMVMLRCFQPVNFTNCCWKEVQERKQGFRHQTEIWYQTEVGGIKPGLSGREECRAQVPAPWNHQHLGSQEAMGQRAEGKAQWCVLGARGGASQGRKQPGGRGELTARRKGIWLSAPQSSDTAGKKHQGREGTNVGAATAKWALTHVDTGA